MRFPRAISVWMVLAFGATGAFGQQKAKLPAAPIAPKQGVKTPGVQIPFESLKPEIEIAAPETPGWIAIADNVFVAKKDALVRIDPKAKESKLLDPIAGIARPCGGVVNAFSSLWVPSCGDGALLKVDAKAAKVSAAVKSGAGSAPGLVAATADSLWMLTDDKTTLSRIDPVENKVVGEFRLPAGCANLTFAETALWVTCAADNRVLRIAADSGLVEKSIEVSATPKSLAAGEGSIWVLCAKDGKIDRIDPKTNKVSKTIELLTPGVDGSLAFGEGFLWASVTGFPLTRIHPTTEQVVQQFYGEGGGVIQAGQGFLWLASTNSPKLLKIDPKRVIATLAE
jgi:virginiamycin B lyase